ncbi:cysteine--tRNA ligase [Candidatus Berkelbacteria bacterium CG10_big_fil_rev_8_21_14_0_10_43_13]|uniref:Cysteine--tRNA ligase n=1 Tax=Candidatus Berkelbacteria bacterium CG10_big_fil_rev_8_21_14_0_10_43_13 TaxID=1974514 RepID=A0A2H0W6U9_9BACT|nr:MAG: cysteine--tRNA ligase [Candidatus Berkelbacteria bacterium CG10_big_fil_rev_8_21_14_0_10_43_13]
MKFYNTLNHKEEEFKSITSGEVKMYTCGPTVYDTVHIGNLRAYTFNDLLKRTLSVNGYKVLHVMNITDVDDKTIKRSGGEKEKFQALTKEYEAKFWSDLKELNILPPTKITRATQYIDKIASFIEELLRKDFAYKTSDGSVYFSIAKFKNYGQLSQLQNRELKPGARVTQDEYDKENPADFVLWKAWDEDDGEIFWHPSATLPQHGSGQVRTGTSLGKGRPGWSIECSVMSTDSLGDTIDIHTGGIDLVFPHHENEIAQSEAETGHRFVNFWLHNEHLLVDGRKMSKSLKNFYTLADIKEKGFSALDFRYLMLSSHYRSKLNFTWEGLEAARNAREKLKRFIAENQVEGEYCKVCTKKFYSKLNDDLMTPEALAVVWELVKDEKKSIGKKIATLKKWDEEILGLGLFDKFEIPAEIIELAEKRKIARVEKDFELSDKLRTEILNSGWSIEDLENNQYKITK